jgi:WD40 repeat protein
VYLYHTPQLHRAETDIKEASFIGVDERFVASGSDDGFLYVWDRSSGNLVLRQPADPDILNCVQVLLILVYLYI